MWIEITRDDKLMHSAFQATSSCTSRERHSDTAPTLQNPQEMFFDSKNCGKQKRLNQYFDRPLSTPHGRQRANKMFLILRIDVLEYAYTLAISAVWDYLYANIVLDIAICDHQSTGCLRIDVLEYAYQRVEAFRPLTSLS